jgi:hypothetical protein
VLARNIRDAHHDVHLLLSGEVVYQSARWRVRSRKSGRPGCPFNPPSLLPLPPHAIPPAPCFSVLVAFICADALDHYNRDRYVDLTNRVFLPESASALVAKAEAVTEAVTTTAT